MPGAVTVLIGVEVPPPQFDRAKASSIAKTRCDTDEKRIFRPQASSENPRAGLYQTQQLGLVPKPLAPLAGNHVGHRGNSITVDHGHYFNGLKSAPE